MVSDQAPAPPPVQPALSTSSTPHSSALSRQAVDEPSHAAAQTLSPPTLQEVRPVAWSISGGVPIALMGSGFSRAQDLLVQFGSIEAINTKFLNEYTLDCTLPKSVSTGIVPVTLLHRQNRSMIPNDPVVEFTYVDFRKEGL